MYVSPHAIVTASYGRPRSPWRAAGDPATVPSHVPSVGTIVFRGTPTSRMLGVYSGTVVDRVIVRDANGQETPLATGAPEMVDGISGGEAPTWRADVPAGSYTLLVTEHAVTSAPWMSEVQRARENALNTPQTYSAPVTVTAGQTATVDRGAMQFVAPPPSSAPTVQVPPLNRRYATEPHGNVIVDVSLSGATGAVSAVATAGGATLVLGDTRARAMRGTMGMPAGRQTLTVTLNADTVPGGTRVAGVGRMPDTATRTLTTTVDVPVNGSVTYAFTPAGLVLTERTAPVPAGTAYTPAVRRVGAGMIVAGLLAVSALVGVAYHVGKSEGI